MAVTAMSRLYDHVIDRVVALDIPDFLEACDRYAVTGNWLLALDPTAAANLYITSRDDGESFENARVAAGLTDDEALEVDAWRATRDRRG